MAREVRRRKQQISQFFRYGLRVTSLDLGLDFPGLFPQLFHDPARVWPVETHFCCPGPNLPRLAQRGHRASNGVQTSGTFRSDFLLQLFDFIPVPQHLCGANPVRLETLRPIASLCRSSFTKHVRMPAHQLPVESSDHIADPKMPRFLRHLRIEQNLQEQIPQLVGKVRPVLALDRVQHLIRLFQRVFADRCKRLLAIPRATARAPQPRHDRHSLSKQLARTRVRRAIPTGDRFRYVLFRGHDPNLQRRRGASAQALRSPCFHL